MNMDVNRRNLLRMAGGALAGTVVLGATNVASSSAPDASGLAEGLLLPAGVQAGTAAAPLSARRPTVRSPFAIGASDSLKLTPQTVWYDCDLRPGVVYRLRAITEGTTATAANAALVCFDPVEPGPIADPGTGLTASDRVGPFIYLRTANGISYLDQLFSVTKPMRRFGAMLWGGRGDVTLKTLSLEKGQAEAGETDFFLSFDCESLPTRAEKDHIDRLIWGKIGRGQYGIPRICDVLEQYKFKANFMIDFASCSREGDDRLREIVDYLAGRGHEVHMHLHSEWLTRFWGLSGEESIFFDNSSYDTIRRMLDFAVSKYRQFVSEDLRVFRTGGFRFNADLVRAAGAVGIKTLTNVREMDGDPLHPGSAAGSGEPFVWENGVLEIPVDLSPEPLSEDFEKYLGRYHQVMNRKTFEKTFNVVLHSWTLMHRNAKGFHDRFEPEHEKRLHQICDHLKNHGVAHGYSDYLDVHKLPRAVTRLHQVRTTEPVKVEYRLPADGGTCNVCDAVFSRSITATDTCPSCGSQAYHRQLRHAFDNYGNVFDGRATLAHGADFMERRQFFAGATSLVKRGINKLAGVADASVEAVVALHVLQQIRDDVKAISDVARVLKPGGVFVSIVPYHQTSEPTQPLTTKGRLTKFRHYNLDEYLRLLSQAFTVTSLPGLDPVTRSATRVFVAYKKS